MKKMLAMFAVCALALSASATKVNWGLTTGQVLNDTMITAGTMYLCYTSTSVDWTAFDNQSSFTADTLATAGFDKVVADFAYNAGKVNNVSTITTASSGLSGANNFYVVCIGEALEDGSQYVAYSPTAQSASISASTMTLPKTQAESAFTYVGTATVPEPTSGLMILLGLAGLALKRKVA